MQSKLSQLKEQLEGALHFDTLHKSLYATDASVYRRLPTAVAFPKHKEDIVSLIQFATENKTSLIPRTAGTSLAGQCVGEGIVIDVSKHFTQIGKVDIDKKTVIVQPGVIRDELNTYLKSSGLFFGPNTSTSNRCMIGGMVGNNSSGTTSIQYGVTRDKVVSISALLSDGSEVIFSELSSEDFIAKTKLDSLEGQIYRTLYERLSDPVIQTEIKGQFPKEEIHRRNTGYAVDALLSNNLFGGNQKTINVCKLLTGSEGTLAFTTEITLQLDVLPPVYTAMVIPQYQTLEACLQDVGVAMKHNLFTCEMMDDVILNCTKGNPLYEPYRFFVEGNPKVLLLLELRAHSKEKLDHQVLQLLASLKESANSYVCPVLMDDDIDKAMALRKAGLGLLGNMIGDNKAVACIEDTAVALSDLPAYITEFTELMAQFDQKAVYYAHAGAGELHLRPILNLKTEEGVEYFRKITTAVAKLTKKYRGSFSGEHGDGIVRGEFLQLQIGPKNFQLLKEIKKVFDPQNILNPGKITDAWPMDVAMRTQVDKETPNVPTMMDFSDAEGLVRLAEKCNGSGDCRKTEKSHGVMCPSYHATKDEQHTTRGRANMLREVLTQSDKANKFDSVELKQVFDLCLSCKACVSECPSTVDISSAKAEFLYQYAKTHGRKRSDSLFGKSSVYNKKAARFPKISNALFSNKITSRWIKNYSGVALERDLPKLAPKAFQNKTEFHQTRPSNPAKQKVALFVDEFCNYYDVVVAEDAQYVLSALGYEVLLITELDSARALLSKGFLEEAKVEIDTNVDTLKELISEEMPLLGLEPSAILGFRDEYIRLATDAVAAKKLSECTYLVEEFLASEIENGNIDSGVFTSEEKNIKIHVHCHQKALSNTKFTFDVLNLPENYKPTIINAGCCGMAGSFGYEKEHYSVSMAIGEQRLFPAVRKSAAATIIVANGTSCRHQIKDGTTRQAKHPITVLREALLATNR